MSTLLKMRNCALTRFVMFPVFCEFIQLIDMIRYFKNIKIAYIYLIFRWLQKLDT